MERSAEKVYLTFFWDCEGILLEEHPPKSVTTTKESYFRHIHDPSFARQCSDSQDHPNPEALCRFSVWHLSMCSVLTRPCAIRLLLVPEASQRDRWTLFPFQWRSKIFCSRLFLNNGCNFLSSWNFKTCAEVQQMFRCFRWLRRKIAPRM